MATEATAREVGADALLLKPFSPLELLAVVERVAAGLHATPFRATGKRRPDEQLLLYARDLRHLLELERGHRRLLQSAYHETVTALASALESKDHSTGEHSQRVHRYAARARAGGRTRGLRRRARRLRLHAPRRRQDRDPGSDPAEARAADRHRAPPDGDAHRARRAAPARGLLPARAAGSRSSARTTSAGTAAAIPTGVAAPRSGRGADLRRRRRARRDDQRPAVPPRDELGRRGPRARAAGRARSSTRR